MLPLRVSRKGKYVAVDQDDTALEQREGSEDAPRADGEERSGDGSQDRNRNGSTAPVSASGTQNVPMSFAASDLRRNIGRRSYQTFVLALVACMIICLVINFFSEQSAAAVRNLLKEECPCRPSDVPQYFQTSPELWPGPTATGNAPFLAQTVAFEPTGTYLPNDPLKTNMPIKGMKEGDDGIFKLMGALSPYSPSPGFGVNEYPLPPGAEIVQVQMLSRHGSRYPTSGSNVALFGRRIAEAAGEFEATGVLSFLNHWKYGLGAEILVPKGRQELYDSGVLHSYMYSKLYNPNSKIIARTTTQDRMLKSAENFMAGFFGLEWTDNATIEVIIEETNFNNSLAGYLRCPNSGKVYGGTAASEQWRDTYLRDATERFRGLISGYEWTIDDTYAAQTLCPYETVAYGFSMFCDLFTYDEWVGFEYSIDIAFSGSTAFQSPTGRAIGIGYQQEVMARLRNHTLGYSGSQINTTLDSSTETFPLNQSLYFDFSHDTNIVSILTAFGFRQFSQFLDPTQHPGAHNLTVSHVTPFAARLDVEIIHAPSPLSPDRSGYQDGDETKYIHFILNQRTLPLGASFPECGNRVDGWCELDTFMQVQDDMEDLAQYEYACFGDYEPGGFGDVHDGAPPRPEKS